MKIPKSFQLAGKTIKVGFDESLLHKDDCYGVTIYREERIDIQPSCKNRPITKTKLEQTFCHELIHWILHSMGDHEKNKNEQFVELFSIFLHQALNSMKYK